MKALISTLLLSILFLTNCSHSPKDQAQPKSQSQLQSVPKTQTAHRNTPYLQILGIAQDAGYPQAACTKSCCQPVWQNPSLAKHATSLGLIDPKTGQHWLFEASPDLKWQLQSLNESLPQISYPISPIPTGIFLTHAHIGHYTGLIHFGREVMGTKNVPVYAMPRMRQFLAENGPWSQLITLQNISLQNLSKDSTIELHKNLKITPFRVPHRDEFSETVGFKIVGPEKSALFIPDIDKWQKWDRNLADEISKVDYALLDGTFFQNGEIPGRDMSEIPHPFIKETMDLLKDLPKTEKAKVHFIHFNHTNPVLQENSKAQKEVKENGFRIAKEGMILEL